MGDLLLLEKYKKRQIRSTDHSEMTRAFFFATGIMLTVGAVSEEGGISDKIIGWFGVANVSKKEAGENYSLYLRATKAFNHIANGELYAEPKDILVALLDAIVGERIANAEL